MYVLFSFAQAMSIVWPIFRVVDILLYLNKKNLSFLVCDLSRLQTPNVLMLFWEDLSFN